MRARYHRLPYLSESLRDIFLCSLERTRHNYRFRVYGYVVMPEHVHLLVSEPDVEMLSKSIQALKISVARSATPVSPFWQKRYHDHNVRHYKGFAEKLDYMHRNPVKRGLCECPENWRWSSFRHYATGEVGVVEIESEWTARRRERPTSAKTRQMWGTVGVKADVRHRPALRWMKKARHRGSTAHERARYRCFLPDLAGLAGKRRAEPMPDVS